MKYLLNKTRESLFYDFWSFGGDVCTLYAPFFRVEVVGAVAQILHEADRYAAVFQCHYAARSIDGDGFASHIGHCCGIVYVAAGESIAIVGSR